MGMHRWSLLLAAALLLAGCTAIPQQHAVKAVHICGAEDCAADHKYSVGQLRTGFQQLLKANEGEKVTICDSDPETRACKSVGICQFVLGGVLPGNGCADNIVFSEIATGDKTGQVNLKADMPLTFIWTPVRCVMATAILTVQSADEIFMEFQPRYCNWMAVGNMTATFNFAVESIDLSHGQIGAYWSHAVKGTGIGRGSGYMLLKFPKSMPGGKNWFAGQASPPPSEEALAQLKLTPEGDRQRLPIWKEMHDEEASWSSRSFRVSSLPRGEGAPIIRK